MISSDVKVRKVSSIPRSYPKATATNRKKKKKKKKKKDGQTMRSHRRQRI